MMYKVKKPNRIDYFYFSRGKLYFDKNRYINSLERYCNELEKALDNACKYIHNDGIDGCPFNYDISAIESEKMNECNICDYQCSSKQCCKEYLKKSIKCWKEYFLKGDTENDKQ